MDDHKTPVTKFTRCGACGEHLDDLGHCRPCAAARSRRWYSETSTLASAKRGLAAKLKRRFSEEEIQGLTAFVIKKQRGYCACCGNEGTKASGLRLEWSLDQVNDEGLPMYRGALCRPCKIAVGRVVHPSRYRLTNKRLAQVERYLELPWQDPAPTMATLGYRSDWRAELEQREADARMDSTNETLAFLHSIGVKVGV